MNPKKFFAELKRRRVYSVAVAYLIGGWALAQGIAQVLPVFHTPIWVVRLIVLLIILGFPVALLNWFFDLTRTEMPERLISTLAVSTPSDLCAIPVETIRPKNRSLFAFQRLKPVQRPCLLQRRHCEELLGALAKVDGLRVAARSSSFWFKDKQAELGEIASKLNVGHVLEGSVRRDETGCE